MKSIIPLFLLRKPLCKPSSLLQSNQYSSPSSSPKLPPLTQEQLTQINLLIPRLCDSNHLPVAIRLFNTSLLTNPPLRSLPLSILTHHLTAQPDMIHTMSLLTQLAHNAPYGVSALLPLNKMLLISYFKKRRFKEAMKIFNWMCRPGSPCNPDLTAFGILVTGFCKNWKSLEGLKVLKRMVEVGFVPGNNLRVSVYMSLLREARVKEARELDDVLGKVGNGGKAVEIIERILREWKE